ncbi:MAG: hypothetical protein U9R19_12325, partial [Bacteroidota bacterium]|nr:hypothetical protein [Bacteroidota bacterium]
VTMGETFIISYGSDFTNFYNAFGFHPDMVSEHITGDGDDGYYLYLGGDHTTGILIDAFGNIDEDGTGQNWEYTDSKAVRLNSVSTPNATWTASEWTITSATASQTGPGAHNNFVTWTGKNSETWNNTANWGNGAIPTSSTNVKVPVSATNFPTISAAATTNNILIEPGASLVGVDNLTLSGTATTKQTISAYTDNSDGWHLISCPMSDMAIAGSDFVSDTYDFYLYDEATDTWMNHENHANEALFNNFTPGLGYLAGYETTSTKSFTGSLNNANVTVSGLTKANDGWHVLGNPFPSALNWATGWTLTNVGATAQILKADGTGYRVLTSGDDIPANQGFWVQVSTAPGSVTIPVSAAIHSNQAFSAKYGKPNNLKLRLYIDTIRYVETRIIFNNNATDNFDWNFDAHYLPPMSDSIPRLFSFISEEKIALNSINFNNNKTINLGTEVISEGQYKLFADGVSSFKNNISIIIEDSRDNIFYDLRELNPINIELLPTDNLKRYLLHFTNDNADSPDISVYSFGKYVYINNNNDKDLQASINISNMLGQEIWHGETNLSGLQKIRLRLSQTYILVKINTNKNMITEKLFIR